jgi:hypothetical protein
MAEPEAFKGVFDQKHLRKDVVHAENIYWRSDYPLETWKNHKKGSSTFSVESNSLFNSRSWWSESPREPRAREGVGLPP